MATIVFAEGFRVRSSDLALIDIADFGFFSGSTSELRFFDDAQNYTSLLGTDLFFTELEGELIDISEGTITGLTSFVAGVQTISVTDWNIDAEELFDLVVEGDSTGLNELLLGDDTIILSNKKDNVDAGGGDDDLRGLKGNDTLSGGGGSDSISGGRGNDTLSGGKGGDAFIFDDALLSTNSDTITDFNDSIDVIHLNSTIFAGLGDAGEVVSSSRFAIGEPQDSSDRLIYDPATGALLYDADGNGAGLAIQFALVGKNLDLTAESFLLI